MPPIKELFVEDLLSRSPEKTISVWMIESIPYAFNDDLNLYVNWKHVLSDKIGVDSSSILLTGSGSVGVSLNPYKNYRDFNLDSDIDVAIISDYYFNEAWRYMRNLGSGIHKLPPPPKQAILKHVSKYIYWGTIATDLILSYLPFGKKWRKALEEMSHIEPTIDRTINARIYKDFESLRAYHTNNLKNLRSVELEKGT